MNSIVEGVLTLSKPLIRPIARATVGRVTGRNRLSGPLAKLGGAPVRDVRLRPWASSRDGRFWQWHRELRSVFRSIFVSGIEGLPQPLAERFAREWAARCECRYGLMLGHGTDALRIGLAAALDHDGLDYGGEVIVPNYSFIASASSPLDRRFGIVLVDVDAETLLIDPRRVEEAVIPGRTRAILPVHLFGQPADLTALSAIAERHKLVIIEDAAQAHGAAWANKSVGAHGHAGAFSFQSSKNLSCGEGGALVTNDEALYERAHAMHNVGRPRTPDNRWKHDVLGWNCRPTEYQAAVLLQRLDRFNDMQEIRAGNFAYLRERMRDIRSLVPLGTGSGVTAHGMYMFVMRYRPGSGAPALDEFIQYVKAEGVPLTRAFAATLAQQPAIRGLLARRPEYLRVTPTPVADAAALETAYLPHDLFLGTRSDMDDIVAAFAKVELHFAGARRGAVA
jgi:dTDP-4-amino-4,6-dideoxygalactose transaminase